MAKKGGINAERAKVWREKTALEKKPAAGLDDRAMRPTIIDYIVPQKQAAKRHYGSHQYFTKRAWNVVQSYIKQFTNEGDVVCDPYGGSGVTVIEALALGRRGVYVDISRWAAFLAEQIAATPVDLSALQTAFEHVEQACGSKISRWAKLPETLIQQIPLTRWYPKNYKLPRNADVSTGR